MGDREKEAYACSFEFFLRKLDFLTHGGIKPCKNIPLSKICIIECLINLLYHGTIVAPLERVLAPLIRAQDQGGSKFRWSRIETIFQWEEEEAFTT